MIPIPRELVSFYRGIVFLVCFKPIGTRLIGLCDITIFSGFLGLLLNIIFALFHVFRKYSIRYIALH